MGIAKREVCCRMDEEDEGRIWVDLLVGQMFAEIKVSNNLYPSALYTPEI